MLDSMDWPMSCVNWYEAQKIMIPRALTMRPESSAMVFTRMFQREMPASARLNLGGFAAGAAGAGESVGEGAAVIGRAGAGGGVSGLAEAAACAGGCGGADAERG